MKNYILLTLFFFNTIFFSEVLFAQKKNQKPNSNLILADKHFDNLEYYQAANEYARVLKVDSSSAYAMFQLAECYRFYYNYTAAELYYHKVATRFRGTYPLSRYWYATMLKDNGNYKKAIENFERYRNENFDTNLETGLYRERALSEIKGCYLAIAENSKPRKAYQFKGLPTPINSLESDYSPVLLGNDSTIAITSSRLNGMWAHENKSLGGVFSDVYRFSKRNDSIWEPLKINQKDDFEKMNSSFSECSGSFSKNKTKYYFTRCDEIFVVDNYKEVNCVIYVSEFKNGRWEEAKKLNSHINAPMQWNSQPSVSEDGNILFFVSKRPGGIGMQDIWFSTCNGDDQWGPSINLGNGVNTLFSDVSPRYYPNEKVLFFSSNGHGGYGALDIFMTREEAGFENAMNIGYPFNSKRDDFYFVLGEKKGYVASNREGGKGNDDIYTFEFKKKLNLIYRIEDSTASENDESIRAHKESREEPIMDLTINKFNGQKYAQLSGLLIDSLTKNPAKEVEVRIVDEYGEAIAKSITNEKGNYKFYNIPTNKEYNMVLNNTDSKKNSFLTPIPKIEFSATKIEPIIEIEPEKEQAVFRDFLVTTISRDTLNGYKAFIVQGFIKDSTTSKFISKGQVQLIDEFGNIVQVSGLDSIGSYKIENITDFKSYIVQYKVFALSSERFTTSDFKLLLEANSNVPHSTDALISIIDRTSLPDAKSITIDGIILYKDTRKPAANATILLADENGVALKTSKTDKNGYYKFSNLGGSDIYKIFLHQGELVKDSEEKKYLAENVQVHSSQASANRQLFENIYFDFNRYTLRNEAKKVLDELVCYCKGDTTLQIELYANTDSYGSSQYNKILAANRGKAAMDYLMSKGLKQSSMVVNSLGENNFVASNETELGRRLNRRMEFYVLGGVTIESKTITHVIETNKTISSLASEYDMTIEELRELNGLVGDELVAYTPIRLKRRGADIGHVETHNRNSSTNDKLEELLIVKNQLLNKNFDFNKPEFKRYIDSLELVEKIRATGYNLKLADIGYYRAMEGNTISGIARVYGIPVNFILGLNGLKDDSCFIGQQIKLDFNRRDPFVKGYIVQDGDSLEYIANRFGLSIESLKEINKLEGYPLVKNMIVRFQ